MTNGPSFLRSPILIRDSPPQLIALDFSCSGLGQLFRHMNPAWQFVPREIVLAVMPQLFLDFGAVCRPIFRYHPGVGVRETVFVLPANYCGFEHLRMLD